MFCSAGGRCLIVAAVLTCNPACWASEETDRLDVIAGSTLSNRKAFAFVNCRFVLTHGKSDREEPSVARGPLRVKLVGNGIWIVRQDQVRYELRIDPTIERQQVEKGIAAQLALDTAEKKDEDKNRIIEFDIDMKFMSRKVLWNGTQGMRYSPMLSGGGLLPPDQAGPEINMTPFDLVGMMGRDESRHPGSLIEQSKNRSGISCRFDGTEQVRGRDLLAVTYDDSSGTHNVRSKFWFDPERGFLPVQMTKQSDNPNSIRTKVVVTDVRECSGGRWFPMRSIKILSRGPRQPDKELDIFELVVRQLDVDTPPTDKMLAIDIPKGARLHNRVDPLSQGALRKRQRVSVADFGGMKEDMSQKAEKRRIEHEREKALALEESEPSRNWLAIGISTALLVVVVITTMRLTRRR